MRSRSMAEWIVAALCVCALATEQPAQSPSGDILVVAVPNKYCHFYWPLRYTKEMSAGQWVSKLQPYHLTVDMPIDPNRPCPGLLSRVE